MPSLSTERAGTPAAVHRAYRDLGVVGYILYGVGAVGPFLRDALGLSDAQTGFHSSLVAIGLLTAGLVADRADRRAGASRVQAGAAVVGAGATLLLAWAPALAATLLAALLIGLTAGLFLGHVNGLLGSDGGPEARLHLLRANVFGIVGPFVVPLVIALGIGIGVGWRLVLVPSLVLLALVLRDALRHGIPLADRATATGRLPRAYWISWLLLAVVVGVEFAITFWAATLVERQTGASVADAALAAGLFFLGMLLGRIGLSVPALGERAPLGLVRAGLGLAIAGVVVAWLAPTGWLAAAGLLLAGLGISGQYPLNAALSIGAGQAAPGPAAARLTLASGSAILLAPLVLGALADAVGVGPAWLLVPGMCVVGLALTVVVPSGSDTSTDAPRDAGVAAGRAGQAPVQ